MKNNYEKYIKEVYDMKEKAYEDFKKSGLTNYIEYIKNELKNEKIKYRKDLLLNNKCLK